MTHGIFDDWRYRYSRVFKSGDEWRYFTGGDDFDGNSKPLRWWNPAHLVRMGIHWLWVRRYW